MTFLATERSNYRTFLARLWTLCDTRVRLEQDHILAWSEDRDSNSPPLDLDGSLVASRDPSSLACSSFSVASRDGNSSLGSSVLFLLAVATPRRPHWLVSFGLSSRVSFPAPPSLFRNATRHARAVVDLGRGQAGLHFPR